MAADRENPDGTAVAVVAWTVDVLHVECVEETTPGVPVVVAFDDVLATIVESAIAEDESGAAIFQIILVVLLDGVADKAAPILS